MTTPDGRPARAAAAWPRLPAQIPELRTGQDWAHWLRTAAHLPGRNNPAVPAAEAWHALTWLARREGFAVEREHCGQGDGVTMWHRHTIRVAPGPGAARAVTALAHELGHILLHRPVIDPPGVSTAGCRGVQQVEAVSVAFVVCSRLGVDTCGLSFPYVASWAGSDPRARPQAAIRLTAAHILQAAGRIGRHLGGVIPSLGAPGAAAVTAVPGRADTALPRDTPDPGGPEPSAAPQAARPAAAVMDRDVPLVPRAEPGPQPAVTARPPPQPVPAAVSRVLADAAKFYAARLAGSWVPGYLAGRGLGGAAERRWDIGYAPGGWTALADHLRGLGHHGAAIEAAGLARRTRRGVLADFFRDRVVLAIRDEHGRVAGFIGRARPGAGGGAPRYLNSPQTAAFSKGELLFGLHQSRGGLAGGAVPVLVEGPFDAIAVTVAGGGRYAGVAPCGTALTGAQAAALARVADLGGRGVLVALDGDRAGRAGAVKAYGVLCGFTGKTMAAVLPPGRDPAQILQADGPAALAAMLRDGVRPLADLVTDAHLARWEPVLDSIAGQLNAMRSLAAKIADAVPASVAGQIAQLTGGRLLDLNDKELQPAVGGQLERIARLLPADVIRQICLVADRLGFGYSDVTAEVANTVTRHAAIPKHSARDAPGRVDGLEDGQHAHPGYDAAELVRRSFPASALPTPHAPVQSASPARLPGTQQQRRRGLTQR